MTTLVHIGDFHAAPGPRNQDRYRALDQILAECLELPRLGAWLWPGDLSHQRQAIDDKNALASRLQRMANRAPVLIVYGNHDLPGDLDVFAHLKAAYPITVVSTPTTLRIKCATGVFATVFCLPYPTKAGLVALGVVPAEILDVAGEALDRIFMQAAQELETARAGGDLTWMIGHVNVGGAETAAGQPNIGREIELWPGHLQRFGGIYIGLNHIHKRQFIHGAHYAGSVCRLDWGEVDPKSYTVVNLEGETVHVEYRPIDVPPMYHLEGALTRDGFVLDADPDLGLRRVTSWAGCEVRVRYRYRQSEKPVLNEQLVRARFTQALRLKVEPIAVPDRALRAPAVALAQTLAEKITAWAEASGIPETETFRAKLARLEHTDPVVLLREVQAELEVLEDAREAVAV